VVPWSRGVGADAFPPGAITLASPALLAADAGLCGYTTNDVNTARSPTTIFKWRAFISLPVDDAIATDGR